MFNGNSIHVDTDDFLAVIADIDVVSLHTQLEDKRMGFEESVVGGGDPTKITQAIQEAKPGTNFCLTYKKDAHIFHHITFIKVDDTGMFFGDDTFGYSFANTEETAKAVKEGLAAT